MSAQHNNAVTSPPSPHITPLPTSTSSTSPSSSPLLLYFDVNQTIILCDTVSSVSAEDATNMLIADHAWGTFDPDLPSERQSWTLTAAPIVSISPPHFITYSDWLESHSVYRKDNSLSIEESRRRKAERGRLRSVFTAEGQPGHALHPLFLHLHSLTLIPPKFLTVPSSYSPSSLPHYYILPAFFRFILYLQHHRRAFRLCFRSFGHDLPTVQKEWNAFCEGQHPRFREARLDGSGEESRTELYVNDDGSIFLNSPRPRRRAPVAGAERAEQQSSSDEPQPKDDRNLVDRRLYDGNCGYAFRTGSGEADSHLLWGAMPADDLPSDVTAPSALPAPFSSLTVHSGFAAIHSFLSSALPPQATIAIRDFYSYWELNHRSVTSGKLLLVDTAQQLQHDAHDAEEAGVRAVFFDDSLHENIVDVRAVNGSEGGAAGGAGDVMQLQQAMEYGVFVHHARCLNILQDEDYFIKVLQEAEAIMQSRRKLKLTQNGSRD